jgi:hypothetical protein
MEAIEESLVTEARCSGEVRTRRTEASSRQHHVYTTLHGHDLFYRIVPLHPLPKTHISAAFSLPDLFIPSPPVPCLTILVAVITTSRQLS